MSSGAAILNFGDEFGPNAIGKAMKNDGPDLSANNLRANKVTPFLEKSESMGADQPLMMGTDKKSPGYNPTTAYGGYDSTSDEN